MAARGSSSFDSLCRSFPLRPIRTKKENEKAIQVADKLLDALSDLTKDEKDYLQVLGELIHRFESEMYVEDAIEISPHQLIKGMIDDQGLKQSELSKELQIAPSRLSEFLSGKRKSSRELARKLCDRFALSIEKIFPIQELVPDNTGRETLNYDMTRSTNARTPVVGEAATLEYLTHSASQEIEGLSLQFSRLAKELQRMSARISKIEKMLQHYSGRSKQ